MPSKEVRSKVVQLARSLEEARQKLPVRPGVPVTFEKGEAHGPVEPPPRRRFEESPEYYEFMVADSGLMLYLRELAADPRYIDEIHVERLDIHGPMEIDLKAGMERLLSALQDGQGVAGVSGLARAVQALVKEAGYSIANSGAGCGGWDVGVTGTGKQIVDLCDLLWTRFGPALAAGLLVLRRSGLETPRPVWMHEIWDEVRS